MDAAQQRQRAVVVDDHDDIRELLSIVLDGAGLEVSTAADGASAIELVREVRPDLVTLDLSLPDMDGTDVCRELRGFSDAYVVMITSRDAEIDRLLGLEVGADDYMAKPFSPREVRARVAALLRRPRAGFDAAPAEPVHLVEPGHPGHPAEPAEPAEPADPAESAGRVEPVPAAATATIEVGGGLMLDAAHHAVVLDGERVLLTPAEFDLLQAIASRPGQAWERGDLVREVWQGQFIESDYLVDVHIGNLRRKLRRAGSSHVWIRTVDGSRYAFDVA